MMLIQVLLGHAVLPDWSTFAERPPALQFSLQSDSIPESGMDEVADLSRSMNVYSRGIFGSLHSNASSFVEEWTGPHEDRECDGTETYWKDGKTTLCCESEGEAKFEKRLTALHDFKPVMTMTHLVAGCSCLCGGFGMWQTGAKVRADSLGITEESYSALDAKKVIVDGTMVHWSQLHVLAHARVLQEMVRYIGEPKDVTDGKIDKAKFEKFKGESIQFWTDYEAKLSNANLGFWNQNVEKLIRDYSIVEWGRQANGMPKVRPRRDTPVLDYQLDKLKEKSIELGKIEMCIDGLGRWKEDTPGALAALVDPISSTEWAPDGKPVVGKRVTLSQESVLKGKGKEREMAAYIEGKRKAALHNALNSTKDRSLKKHLWRNQLFVDPKWDSDISEEEADILQKRIFQAELKCKKDKFCCGLDDEYNIVHDNTKDKAISYKVNRRPPQEEDLAVIEVVLNFQGRLTKTPRVWSDAAMAVKNSVDGWSGNSCPEKNIVCHCGCVDSVRRDPFNGHPPVLNHLVTAEQAAVFYYYYEKDIVRDHDNPYTSAGKHWTWLPKGLTFLARNNFDLPGIDPNDIDSPGPREGEPVTPYQLHYLLAQSGSEWDKDIAKALLDRQYIQEGSKGLKPCDTKQVDANRLSANADETELILNQNQTAIKDVGVSGATDRSNDAPMIQQKPWLNRADDFDDNGIIKTGKKVHPNRNPHDGMAPYDIPKTMAYADILHELRNQEQLRKERFFKEEIPIYWLRGYHAWKLNQDVRELENKYFKNLYITSNAAARIVKKEYDVDNKLTDNVSKIIEQEAKERDDTGNPKERTQLWHFSDHNSVSRFGQAEALHRNSWERSLLSHKEMRDNDLQNTLGIMDEHDARSIAKKQATAALPGERVMLKYSAGVKLKLKSVPSNLKDYFPTEADIERSPEILKDYTFVLGGYMIRKKQGTGNIIDCPFTDASKPATPLRVRIMSQFHNCLTYGKKPYGLQLEKMFIDAPDIEDLQTSQEFIIEPLQRWATTELVRSAFSSPILIAYFPGQYGSMPAPGMLASKVQLDTLCKSPDPQLFLWRTFVKKLKPACASDPCACLLEEKNDHDQLYSISVVFPEKTFLVSWQGDGENASKLSGKVKAIDTARINNEPGRTEIWSIIDDGNGGLSIMAYDPGTIPWDAEWMQIASDNYKCKNAHVEEGTFNSQASCQKLAESQGQTYYQFDPVRRRCGTVTNCEKNQRIIESTDLGWKIYHKAGMQRSNMIEKDGEAMVEGSGRIQPWSIVDAKTLVPVCKVSVDLQVPVTKNFVAMDEKKTGKISLRTMFRGTSETKFLDSIEAQDLEDVVSSKGGKGEYVIKALAKLLQWVQLPVDHIIHDPEIGEQMWNMERATVVKMKKADVDQWQAQAKSELDVLKIFLEGPWQIKANKNSGFGVELKAKNVLDGFEGQELKTMTYNRKPVWSLAGKIDLADLTAAESNFRCGGGTDDSPQCKKDYKKARENDTLTGVTLIKHIKKTFCDATDKCGSATNTYRDTCSLCCMDPCLGVHLSDNSLREAVKKSLPYKMLLDHTSTQTEQFVRGWMAKNPVYVDVREEEEPEPRLMVPGRQSLHIPILSSELTEFWTTRKVKAAVALASFPKNLDTPIIVFSSGSGAAGLAAQALTKLGYSKVLGVMSGNADVTIDIINNGGLHT